MYQSQVHDNNNVSLSESQIYDDLSQIIKSFKSILTSMQNISATLYRYEPINLLMQQLNEKMKGLYEYVKLYSTPVDNYSQHKNTFHRFICRLIESISTYKVRFQNQPYYIFLSSDINIIEQGVISYQQQRNIGSVIKKLQTAINRFCNKMIKKYQLYMKTNQNEEDDMEVSQERRQGLPVITGEYHQVVMMKEQQAMELLAMNMEVRPVKTKVQSKSQSSLNRVMNLLTRRFKSLSCLDIEYNQFRQFFFRSRDSKQQLYDDCLQRNSLIYKQMLRYSRQFTEYMQRKELKLYRKNKFIDSLMMTTSGVSNRVRRVNHNNNKNNNNNNISSSSNTGGHQQQQVGYNFTKKRVNNSSHFMQNDGANVNYQNKRKVVYGQIHTQVNSRSYQYENERNVENGQLIDGRESHLRSIDQVDSCDRLVPQLLVSPSPLLTDKVKQTTLPKDHDERFQDMSTQTLLELTKRKKNLQLKKIDISLNTFSFGGGEVQTTKARTKLLNTQLFKKTPVQSIKHFEQKVTTNNNNTSSIRRNYLHRKYEQAMRKNLNNDTLIDQNQLQKAQQQYSSSVKCIDPDGSQSPGLNCKQKQKKYLFKTTNKRNSNGGVQYMSLNHQQRKEGVMTNKNFRKLRVEKGEKIDRIEKMKEMAINHMELRSGGRAIRPAFIYRQRESTQHPYIQMTQQDFSDTNLVPSRQVE